MTLEFRSKSKIPLKKNHILQIFGIILLILQEIIPNSRKIMVFFMEFYFCYESLLIPCKFLHLFSKKGVKHYMFLPKRPKKHIIYMHGKKV